MKFFKKKTLTTNDFILSKNEFNKLLLPIPKL